VKLAIVHDWLTGMRGGERFLEALCKRYPDAELFTLIHVRGSVAPVVESARIHTSLAQWLPGVRRYYRKCLPLYPALVEQFDLEGFDLVISSSHCVAKSVITLPGTVHICYCHTPMRYAWDQFDAYFGRERLGPAGHWLMRRMMAGLARWDRETADRVDCYLTNSQHVAGRIRRYYNRQALVVHPPVDTEFFHPDSAAPERFALVVSALVPYKRLEIAIDACRLARVPLKIVGVGPDRARLAHRRGTGADVEFLGRVADETLRGLYQRAALTLMTGEEDFGIAPLEAQACGRPVVALARGGALETVAPGETGFLVEQPTAEAFADAIAQATGRSFDPTVIRLHAERFGRARFHKEMEAAIQDALSGGHARTRGDVSDPRRKSAAIRNSEFRIQNSQGRC
jgi:glycosyltransferase involved in cell wall biosynthesis